MSETRGNHTSDQAQSGASAVESQTLVDATNTESHTAQAATSATLVPSSDSHVTQTATPASRQIDFFAEQNAKTAEKKAKSIKTIKKIFLIAGPILGLLIIGLVVWLVLSVMNKPAELNLEEIDNLRFTFVDIYNQDRSLDDVRNRYNQILDTEIGKEHADQVKLQMLYFYMSNGYAARAVELGESINVDKLNLEAKTAYYSQMYNAYLNIDNPTKALEMQYESAMLKGDLINGENPDENNGDNNTNNSDSQDSNQGIGDKNEGDNTTSDNNNSGSGTDGGNTGGATYTCDGVTYAFPVQCSVNGVEPDVF